MEKHKNKTLLILSILLIVLLTGAVNATEDTDNMDTELIKTQANDDSISLADNDEQTDLLTDDTDGSSDNGNFNNLTDILKGKGYGKTIHLEKNYTYNNETDSSEIIYLGTFTSIDGHGYTIDGNNKSTIFETVGTDIVLKNIIFKNTRGNALIVGSDTVSIINCTFDNCTGSINIQASGVNCIVDESHFINGGRMTISAPNTIIKNSEFKNNNLSTSGGAIYCNSNNTVIQNCIFEGNNATQGGAICYQFQYGVLNIRNSTFKKNSAVTGGAIYIPFYQTFPIDYYSLFVDIDSDSRFIDNCAVNSPTIFIPEANTNLIKEGITEKYFDDLDKIQ